MSKQQRKFADFPVGSTIRAFDRPHNYIEGKVIRQFWEKTRQNKLRACLYVEVNYNNDKDDRFVEPGHFMTIPLNLDCFDREKRLTVI